MAFCIALLLAFSSLGLAAAQACGAGLQQCATNGQCYKPGDYNCYPSMLWSLLLPALLDGSVLLLTPAVICSPAMPGFWRRYMRLWAGLL